MQASGANVIGGRSGAGHTEEVFVAAVQGAPSAPLPGGPLLRAVDRTAEAVIGAALLGEVASVFLNVIARTFFEVSLLWTEEVASLALSLMAFVGGVVAYRRGHHSSVSLVLDRLPARTRGVAISAADATVLALAIVTFVLSIATVEAGWHRETPILEWPSGVISLPLAISMPLLAAYALERLHRTGRAALAPAAVVLAAAAVATAATYLGVGNLLSAERGVTTSIVLFLVSIALGLPIAFALLLSACIFFWATQTVPMLALSQKMVDGTGNFILLAIPFFIFAGLLMERGGISLRLVAFAQGLVGHLRGGMKQVAVVSMYLMSGLSGSDSADVAAVGTVLRNMPEEGQAGEGAAVMAASAIMGASVPPSIAMLILGSVTQISISALFVGGFVPAAVIMACLMALNYVTARRSADRRLPRMPARKLVRAAGSAMLPLSIPVILFGGILTGAATPTEVSSVAVVYAVLLSVLVYRSLSVRSLIEVTVDSAVLTGMILFVLASASSFSWALTIGNLPRQLIELMQAAGGNQIVFMLGSIVLLVVLSSLLEGLPALNVLAPMLVPLAAKLGFNELHYGMVLLIAMGLGVFIPPAGVGFFVCCAVMRSDVGPAARAMLPYLAVLIAGLLLVAFVPWFTLVLPRLAGLVP